MSCCEPKCDVFLEQNLCGGEDGKEVVITTTYNSDSGEETHTHHTNCDGTTTTLPPVICTDNSNTIYTGSDGGAYYTYGGSNETNTLLKLMSELYSFKNLEFDTDQIVCRLIDGCEHTRNIIRCIKNENVASFDCLSKERKAHLGDLVVIYNKLTNK